MTALQITYLVILGVCILASGFFSGSETALIGIGRERVRQLAEKDPRGVHVEQLFVDQDVLLSTLLVANNVVNILAASVATVLFIDLLGEQWGPWAATGAVTAVILVVGELTPKTLASRFPERFSLIVAPTIWRLSKVLAPVAGVFSAITRVLLRILGLHDGGDDGAVTEADILTLAQLSEEGGEIEAAEREILHALFGLADHTVRDVMTPRVDIHTLAQPVSVEDVRAAVNATGHSRFPVIADDLDQLVGVLYVKDLFRASTDADITSMTRTPFFFPETTTVLAAMNELRRRRLGFGFVLDEHGGVEGIVTMKDLMSELVGELQDEYDPTAPTVVRIGRLQWLADGRLPVEELSQHTGITLPTGPYSTVGGLYLALAGAIPEEGDQVTVDGGARLVVLRMDRNRIDRVRVETPENQV
ncbi:MAG: HlyC/CorC family transporter [Acidimicrobiia bacterium]|nr:hemolysin family protein [Acidimicrobiia bacterium]NNF62940.1 HlyC/CorC family transporter [Acidimicrobiia bacterium]